MPSSNTYDGGVIEIQMNAVSDYHKPNKMMGTSISYVHMNNNVDLSTLRFLCKLWWQVDEPMITSRKLPLISELWDMECKRI